MLRVFLLVSCKALPAQSLVGVVQDEQQNPLASVTVVLPALQRWTSTDAEGTFSFRDLPDGRYVLEASLVGYTKASREIELPSSEPLTAIVLHSSHLNEAYYDHLSRYKMFALNPGRSISLKISTPFQILE